MHAESFKLKRAEQKKTHLTPRPKTPDELLEMCPIGLAVTVQNVCTAENMKHKIKDTSLQKSDVNQSLMGLITFNSINTYRGVLMTTLKMYTWKQII